MNEVKVFDVNGKEIKQDDLVKVVRGSNDHSWLKVGNTLKVSHWEDRSSFLGYVIVFLKTKDAERVCSIGISGNCLELVDSI